MHGRGGNQERPVEALAVERLRVLGERARRLATEVLAAVEELEALALELAAARLELPAQVTEPARTPPIAARRSRGNDQLSSAQVMERLQRLTGQQRALIAEAVERRQQLEAAGLLPGDERRTFRVVPPSPDNIVVQVRAPGERRGMATYVMSPEELQQLLPPEDDEAPESGQPPATAQQPPDDDR